MLGYIGVIDNLAVLSVVLLSGRAGLIEQVHPFLCQPARANAQMVHPQGYGPNVY